MGDRLFDGRDSDSAGSGSGSGSGVFDGFDSLDDADSVDDDTDNEFDESKLLDFDAGDYYGLQAQARQAEGARATDKG